MLESGHLFKTIALWLGSHTHVAKNKTITPYAETYNWS